MKRILIILAFISIAGPLFAATNATTTVSLSVHATDQSLSIRAKFSGDDNANNSALIEYRVTGSMTWISAYAPYIDHRQFIGGTANPNVNEARGVIVPLTVNTSYDVRVTFSDPDGVSGTNPLVTNQDGATFKFTYNTAPTEGGTTCTATDLTTLNSCITSINAGTKNFLHINPGTYSQAAGFSITGNGAANSFIVIEGDSGGGTNLTGGTSNDLSISGNYILVRNLTFPSSNATGINISAGVHDVIIKSVNIQGFAARTVASFCNSNPSTNYNDSGIGMGSSVSNIFILSSTVVGASALDSCNSSPITESPGTAVNACIISDSAVRDTTVHGSFRDGITIADAANCITENVDMSGNTSWGYKDDSVESKGQDINVKIWNNINYVTQALVPTCDTTAAPRCGTNGQASAYGNTCWAVNSNSTTTSYGPLWLFRNQCYTDFAGAGGLIIYKMTTSEPYRIFHNSVNTNTSTTNWDNLTGTGGLVEYYNNITKTRNGNYAVQGANGLLKSVTFSGSASGAADGSYLDKVPTSGTNSCIKTTAGGIYRVSFNVTVLSGVFTSVVINDYGRNGGGCAVNDTLVIPGNIIGGTTPANDLTVTVASVTGFTSDNNLFNQVNNGNNWGKQWDFTDGTSTPTTLSYSNLTGAGGFSTVQGVDTNSCFGTAPACKNQSPCFQNGSGGCSGSSGLDAKSLVILNTSAAANAGKPLTGFNGDNTPWTYSTAKPSIGYYEANPGSCTPAYVAFIQQPAATAGLNASIGTVTVGVYNAGGAICSGDTSNVTVSKHTGATWGTLSGTLTVAAVAGIATFSDLKITTSVGIGAIDAADGALTGATSTSITVSTPCVSDHLTFTDQPASAPSGGNLSTIQVAIQDVNGVTCNDTSVITLSKHAGTCVSQTLGGTISAAAVLGLFTTTNVTMTGTPGQCRLDATTTGGITGTTSTQFSIVATGGGRAGMLLKGKH